MTSLGQIVAVTAIGLLGIPRRVGACLVIVIGLAGVVAVLISVFAMVRGFSDMASKTGRADRAIVLARGADTESASGLSREDVAAVLDAGVVHRDADGGQIASAESLVSLRLTDRRTGLDAFAAVRGVSPAILALRPEIRLLDGRMFRTGVNELVVGRALQRRLQGLDVGSRLSLPQGEWTIVGAFSTDGDVRESELLGDVETLLSAYRRNVFNSVTVALPGAASFQLFRDAVASNPALAVKVIREREYISQSSAYTQGVLRFVAWSIGGIMALGALFAAINAMYSSIGSRSMEIATLRAVGYGGVPVLVSVFLEALAFALIGACIGAALAWRFFNGNAVSMLSSASPAPVAFELNVTPALVILGVVTACAIGLVGGLFASLRAASAPVASALRGG